MCIHVYPALLSIQLEHLHAQLQYKKHIIVIAQPLRVAMFTSALHLQLLHTQAALNETPGHLLKVLEKHGCFVVWKFSLHRVLQNLIAKSMQTAQIATYLLSLHDSSHCGCGA